MERRRPPMYVIAIFVLGGVIAIVGFLVILLHELAGWFTPGASLLIFLVLLAIGLILLGVTYPRIKKKE